MAHELKGVFQQRNKLQLVVGVPDATDTEIHLVSLHTSLHTLGIVITQVNTDIGILRGKRADDLWQYACRDRGQNRQADVATATL